MLKSSQSYSEYLAENGIGKKSKEVSKIIDNSMVALSLVYSKNYESNAKVFMSCFLNYPSIRTACAFIVQSYKHLGLFAECQASGKDFSDYANKQPIEEKWKRVLAEILLIIFSILNP